MGNHCIYTVCRNCGEEYCLRCEFGICPKCGTPWNAKPVSEDDFIKSMKGKTMSIEEIYKEARHLAKTDRLKLVNMILSGLSEKKAKPDTEEKDPVMPVHEALWTFNNFVYAAKGVRYSANGIFQSRDYKHMHELLLKLEARMIEAGVAIIDDNKRIETLKAFMQAVKDMGNDWYYKVRFTPYGLATDFEKIFIELQTQRNHGQQSAFSYL